MANKIRLKKIETTMQPFWVGAAVWLLWSSPGFAASFDCGKAEKAIERLVCANMELSWLDDRMALRYRNVMEDLNLHLLQHSTAGSDNRVRKAMTEVQGAQGQWLRQRDACSDEACVRAAYYARIAALNVPTAFPFADPPRPAQRPRFKVGDQVGDGQGEPACEAYVKFLNSLPANEPLPMCEMKLGQVPGMREPAWVELDLQANLPLLHRVEQALQRNNALLEWPVLEDFEDWRRDLDKRIAGGFKPRLRRVQMSIATGGAIETVLAYDLDVKRCERDREMQWPESFMLPFAARFAGSWLLPAEAASEKAIRAGRLVSTGPASLVSFHGDMLWVEQIVGQLVDNGGQIFVSRLDRIPTPGGMTVYFGGYTAEPVCRIRYDDPFIRR